MGDIAGHSISDSGWIKVKSYLTPVNKFNISDPVMMTPELLMKTELVLNNFIVQKERQLIKLYVSYIFPDYESAACYEFLIRGANLNLKQTLEISGISHKMIRGADDPNKIYGVIALGNQNDADNLYTRVCSTLNALDTH